MQNSSLCQYRAWDSEFFGVRIAEISGNHLTTPDLDSIMRWCDEQKIDCLYFFADSDDAETVKIAESNMFHVVDIRVTFEKRLTGNPPPDETSSTSIIRLSAPGDLASLKAIASKGHYDSRFYYDPYFPNSRCDALYETWIEKSCHGFADSVLVADLEGRASGYISCHLLDQLTGKIGLVGVGSEAQGKGLGTRLIEASLQWFREHGAQRVIVVTQGRNIKAQRLYQKAGFLTQSVQLVYHRWFTA